ncbi:MAG: Sua5/YciO/YrdC/YwlC family protein [Proteobacteria bacterium]|nr:Sua5/YciO/YrdC/YwlC family protein [Pseudomonadota bacterium]MDA1057459.1 Sua5/YciO/YrdC/YwlC family protein [Pseudomonadota bacterium]
MSVLNIQEDAARAFGILKNGGIAILPMDVGYSLIGGSPQALKRIFDTKNRAPSKLNAMLGNDDLHKALHRVSNRGREIYDAICNDYDLPLGLIAPCNIDHPLLQTLDRDTYERSTKGDTLLMLMNSGRFHAEITDLSFKQKHLLFGSSANLTLTGTRFRVDDMQPEITGIADVIVDYGLMKYHTYAASSTLLDVENCAVHRFGVCYENIAEILRRHFDVTLPPKPAD